MSNDRTDEHGRRVAEVAQAVADFQRAVDVVDEAVALRLGVNRTDLRVLDVLFRRGPLTAGQLAEACDLSPGAMTTAIDRVERAGYARRIRDLPDRRSVRVEATPRLRRLAARLYGPIGDAGMARLRRYEDAELALLLAFLEDGIRLQESQAARIRGARGEHGKADPKQ
jgi:DNA-binding MarR family transcriptional regulator